MSSTDATAIFSAFKKSYNDSTSHKLKVCDAFIVFFALNCFILFLYRGLVGSFPFNAYLGGLFSNMGMLIFTVCLRMQAAPANEPQFQGVTHESSFCDYSLCAVLLLFTSVHFMG
ncbi:Dolichyl-diphosphooligosaccharide--protein glycosyltransferase subunit DAD1 [Diplonema papillatum]|nr:Dolichyl-diphosphooligosaccharide--protein glycosyltransferase subunit DAD1 [Diplonema papillatum]